MIKFWCILGFLLSLFYLNYHFHLLAFNFLSESNIGAFRVMTYNTNGVSGDYEDDSFVGDFLSTIDSIQPHVLVLQEMRKEYSALLCQELQNRYPNNSLFELAKQRRAFKHSACLFSKYPIKSFFRAECNRHEMDSIYDEFNVPSSARQFSSPEIFFAILEIEDRKVFVVCCYLKSNDYSKLRKDYSDSWIDGLDEYFNGYNIGSAIRSLNANLIRDSIAKYNLPTIICGDMNDFHYSRAVKIMMGNDLKNVWWERGLGYGMTYNKYHLKLRIDHILISEHFEAVSVVIPHLRFSDHYPIVSDLKFKVE